MEKKNWLERFCSLDELKTSSLVIVLYALVAIAISVCLEFGDVPPNLTTLIIVGMTTIGGANAIGWASSNIANRKTSDTIYTNQNVISTSDVQQDSQVDNSESIDIIDPSNKPI